MPSTASRRSSWRENCRFKFDKSIVSRSSRVMCPKTVMTIFFTVDHHVSCSRTSSHRERSPTKFATDAASAGNEDLRIGQLCMEFMAKYRLRLQRARHRHRQRAWPKKRVKFEKIWCWLLPIRFRWLHRLGLSHFLQSALICMVTNPPSFPNSRIISSPVVNINVPMSSSWPQRRKF